MNRTGLFNPTNYFCSCERDCARSKSVVWFGAGFYSVDLRSSCTQILIFLWISFSKYFVTNEMKYIFIDNFTNYHKNKEKYIQIIMRNLD